MMGAIPKWSGSYTLSGRQQDVHPLKRVVKRVEDLKLSLQNWRMPESYTKIRTKLPPRFVRLPALGEGNSSRTFLKNEMFLVKPKLLALNHQAEICMNLAGYK